MDNFKNAFQSQETEAGGGFSLLDEGTYEAELNDVSLDLERDPARLTVTYVITQEPYAGRKLWGNYQLEGRGIGFLKKDLDTLGIDHSQIGSPEDILELIGGQLNTPVIVFVNQKEWQGKTYNNVYLNALSDVPAALAPPPAPTNQKEADRRAKTTPTPKGQAPVNHAPKSKPATKGKPSRASEPDFGGDDIPF